MLVGRHQKETDCSRNFKICYLKHAKYLGVYLIFSLVFVFVLFNTPEEIFDGEPTQVVWNHLEFKPTTPIAENWQDKELKKEVRITSKFKNFDSATLEDKLRRWKKEYIFRSTRDNHPVRAKIVDLMKKYAPPNGVMVDSGAHLGDTGIPILQKLRQGGRKDIHLVMLEPEYSKCFWIHEKVKEIDVLDPGFADKVHIIQTGVWSHSTHAQLEKSNHPGAWVVKADEYRLRKYMKGHETTEGFETGTIRMMSIDEILTPQARFTLWHLDAEGSETRALMGMTRSHHRPIVVVEAFSRDGEDFKFNSDFLRMNYGYRLVTRLKPNMDRVLIPREIEKNDLQELPDYT